MSGDDMVFVLCAVLSVTDVGEPTRWRVFIQNVARLLSKKTTGRTSILLRKKGYLNQVINTDAAGGGIHWLQAVADFKQPSVRVLEPFGSTDERKKISDHVQREFRKKLRDQDCKLSFMHSGAQATDDGSHCGHISAWFQVSSRVALEQGMNVSEWIPDKPPSFWTDVVSELLRIRDDHARLDLEALDFQSIGLRPILDAILDGKDSMYHMLTVCRQYRAALKEMQGAPGEVEIVTRPEPSRSNQLKQAFAGALRSLRAHPQDASFDLRKICPEWFSTWGRPLRTASADSDSDCDLYLDEDAREMAQLEKELLDLLSDDESKTAMLPDDSSRTARAIRPQRRKSQKSKKKDRWSELRPP
jgi:hypothetical protein